MNINGKNFMSDFEAKKAIVEISRNLSFKGYAVGNDGSVSVRAEQNAFWITSGEENKSFMSIDKLIKIDLDGKFISGSYKFFKSGNLPDELNYHIQMYKENKNISSIIHCYPPEAIIYSMQGLPILKQDFTKSVKRLGEIPIQLYTEKFNISQDIIEKHKGVLLKGNGCLVWGNDLYDTYSNIEVIEYVSKVLNRTKNKILGEETSYVEQDVVKNLKGVTSIVKPSYENNTDYTDNSEKERFIQEVILQVTRKLTET
ncbi:MAG: class II aldolase/adducin family protein [Lachnospirales bacterium]